MSVDESAERGTHLHLVVPAELATIAAHFAPPQAICRAITGNFGLCFPVLQLGAQELMKLPDSCWWKCGTAAACFDQSGSEMEFPIEEDSPKEHVKAWVPLKAIYDSGGRVGIAHEDWIGMIRQY